MADRIHFQNNINDSVQIGDILYFSTLTAGVAGNIEEVGVIEDIGNTWVEVADGEAPTGFVAGGDELVDNGNFDTDLASWTTPVGMTGSHTWDSGRLSLQNVGNTTDSGESSQIGITTIVGNPYVFSFNYEVERGRLDYIVRANDWSHVESGVLFPGDNTIEHAFVATDISYVITFHGGLPHVISPTDAYIDNVSLVTVRNMDLLFMFRKNNQSNISTLVGYFADVTMTQNATDRREIFSIGSEIFVSSK